jgi:hypothetical protein
VREREKNAGTILLKAFNLDTQVHEIPPKDCEIV